jgi:hypothetical protein
VGTLVRGLSMDKAVACDSFQLDSQFHGNSKKLYFPRRRNTEEILCAYDDPELDTRKSLHSYLLCSKCYYEQNVGRNTKNVYAKSAEIKLLQSNSGTVNVNVDLTGKEAVWVKKTVTFTPQTDHAKFSFSGLAQPGNVYSYIHLFVDVNAVKEALQVTPIQL